MKIFWPFIVVFITLYERSNAWGLAGGQMVFTEETNLKSPPPQTLTFSKLVPEELKPFFLSHFFLKFTHTPQNSKSQKWICSANVIRAKKTQHSIKISLLTAGHCMMRLLKNTSQVVSAKREHKNHLTDSWLSFQYPKYQSAQFKIDYQFVFQNKKKKLSLKRFAQTQIKFWIAKKFYNPAMQNPSDDSYDEANDTAIMELTLPKIKGLKLSDLIVMPLIPAKLSKAIREKLLTNSSTSRLKMWVAGAGFTSENITTGDFGTLRFGEASLQSFEVEKNTLNIHSKAESAEKTLALLNGDSGGAVLIQYDSNYYILATNSSSDLVDPGRQKPVISSFALAPTAEEAEGKIF